jgi:serine/threonine protein kinase
MAQQQRTTLARRPLIEALADASRAAFTTRTSPAPARNAALLERWQPAFKFDNNNTKKKWARWAFRYMFDKNNPTFSDDDRWFPVRPLGAGSFGAVGLFEHHDEDGIPDDYVVAKYARVDSNDSVRPNILSISAEAAIMMQLNELPDSEGVLYLRNFKHYNDMGVWLHLLEYCPNLNLEALRLTYKAMRRTLPEIFLWYTFYALAKGLTTMEIGPFDEGLDPSTLVPNAYLLHRDMKPENTFLGFPFSSGPTTSAESYIPSMLSYPHAKIADFGLSTITTSASRLNTAAEHARLGSRWWHPPELRVKHLPPSITTNPFPTTCFDPTGAPIPAHILPSQPLDSHALTPAGNTFAVGLMMHQLLTLDEAHFLHDYLNRIMAQVEPTPINVLHTSSIPTRQASIAVFGDEANLIAQLGEQEANAQRDILDTLLVWESAPYSPELKSLVESCTAFQPYDRPSAPALLCSIHAGMTAYLSRASTTPEFQDEARVFTKAEEMGGLSMGQADVDLDERFWRDLMGAWRWVDGGKGGIRPVMDGSVPDEVRGFFEGGRREGANRVLSEGDGQRSTVRILGAELQGLGVSGSGGNGESAVRELMFGEGSGDVAEIRLDDSPPAMEIRLDDSPRASWR